MENILVGSNRWSRWVYSHRIKKKKKKCNHDLWYFPIGIWGNKASFLVDTLCWQAKIVSEMKEYQCDIFQDWLLRNDTRMYRYICYKKLSVSVLWDEELSKKIRRRFSAESFWFEGSCGFIIVRSWDRHRGSVPRILICSIRRCNRGIAKVYDKNQRQSENN